MKKVIRLTEADIERIVRQVIQEQSDTMPLPQNDTQQVNRGIYKSCPSGGVFRVNGSSLFWADNINNTFYKIWEEGSKPTFVIENGILKPEGYMVIQEEIFEDISDDITALTSMEIKPGQYTWDGDVYRSEYKPTTTTSLLYYSLEGNRIYANSCTVVIVKLSTVKNLDELSNIMGSDGDLPKRSTDGRIIFGDTYVQLKGKRALIVVKSQGGPISYQPETPTTTTKPEFKEIPFSLTDSFKFDKIDFVDETKTNGEINNFIQSILSANTVSPLFKQHVINSKPVVYGYASIDDDPEALDGGSYNGCKDYGRKKGPRKSYNLCLSEARAKKVADLINAGLAGTEMDVFTYKGMGETDKFAPGMKWPEVTDNSKTAPNRRVETKIPTFTYQVN